MSLLVRFERRIEALVEGFFSRRSHVRTHALTKETADGEEIDRTGHERILDAPLAPR